MAKLPPFPGTTGRRDWRTAFDAIKKLLANGDDTTQVFRIMRALNVGNAPINYARLIATEQGGRIAYDQVELAQRFSDPAFVASFAPGTVGAAYRTFLETTGYSADGLVEVSRLVPSEDDLAHPYAWFGRRVRDTHDIWHVLTGYKADESMGEAALVAFSYAQVGGLGWALIGSAAALKSMRVTGSKLFAKAVWEGYRNGRKAKWISGEDYLELLHEDVVISPEMRKARPVVIVGPRLRRRGRLATIIPLSTTVPLTIENYHCGIELSEALPAPFDSIAMWAKCDMITTVSLDRLDRFKGSRTSGGGARKWATGRVSSEQLQNIRIAMLFGLGLDSLTNCV